MNDQAVYRVAAAGLDPRDARLIEIVFRHSQYNRFQFRLAETFDPDRTDILVANTTAAEGLAAVARLRSMRSRIPVIAAVPRGATSPSRYAISIERLTLQLLPILNRVVESEIVSPSGSAPGAPAPGAAARLAGPDSLPAQEEAPSSPPRTPAMPLRRPPGAAPTLAKLVEFPRNAELAGQRIRVLVVDDSPTVRQQLSIALHRMGLACDVADGAATGLERLREAHYDLALVDVVMADTDGYSLTREIRRTHRATPVIILTSKSSPFDLARGALAGCKAYLVKPVPLRKLEAAVTRILRKSLAIDDLASLMRPIPLLTDPKPQPDADAGRRLDVRQG